MVSRLFVFGLAVYSVLMISGCATPVGVSKANESDVYRQINDSVLTSNNYSSYTAAVLHRHGFEEKYFSENPVELIATLNEIACRDERRDIVLALSELCFLAANKAASDRHLGYIDNRDFFYTLSMDSDEGVSVKQPVDPQRYFLGSAVYAYLFLLGQGEEPPPGPYDRRFRLACDLYNRSLANVLTFSEGNVVLQKKYMPLPVGKIHLSLENLEIPWNPDDLSMVLSADNYEVRGLSVRNRVPGLGAPIIAVRKKSPGKPLAEVAAATAFLEINGTVNDFQNGHCSGEISVFSAMSDPETTINGQKIPLEMDLTAPLAYSFQDPLLWNLGRNLFRLGRSLFKPGIYPVQPYRKGLIPLVLVHGTMSSPVWWTEMLNTLLSDPQIRKHFQIWLYLYDSGKPVLFSATHLRNAIEDQVRKYDPDNRDAALRNIVLAGHSQGGLLARMTVLETGETIVKAVTGKTIDELGLSPEEKQLVTQQTVFHPLPEVSRVIFIATPHRGSILAGSLARRVAARLVALPREVVQIGKDLYNISERFSVAGQVKHSMARTSIDSMAPDNPSLLAIAELPFPEDVKAHSIIAVKPGKIPPEGDDGVVSYKSAHIEDVDSELVVPYGHSCQTEPLVIEEVRRIIIEHIDESDAKKEEGGAKYGFDQ